MAARQTRVEAWEYISHIILKTANVAYKGQVAAIELSTGLIVPMASATGLLPIGYFDEDLTGDGVLTVRIHLFAEIRVHRFTNAVSGPVAASDVGNLCYFSAVDTVSMTATSRSVAGRVWRVTTAGVLINPLTRTAG